LSAVVPTIGQWTLLAAQFNGGTSLLRKDGTQIASGSTGGNPIGGVAIGAHSGAANPSACIVVEALVYNATNPGFATVEAYFASKYGAFPQ
jgi:hypothetical protein